MDPREVVLECPARRPVFEVDEVPATVPDTVRT
jgi:hypothetical protein